ncbi:MAG TPA: lipase family protein [Ignavibacteria bacterium]|nr:lipase family protein [Ignavibacteria bacterium]HMR42041.1 lipase family protein [Ignavibacteria bacterium]
MNLKILKPVILILFSSFLIFSIHSCTEDSNNLINTNNPPPELGGYETGEAGIIMTLASLCYTAENNPNHAEIKDSLLLQLADTAYSTKGKWKLAWGPGISPSGGNMMYVAVDSTSDTINYAIAIRGTDWTFPSNYVEDMVVWRLDKYPYGGGVNDSVAAGSLDGLDTLLSVTDNGKTLAMFLNEINGSKLKMFITGHSLGGAMATMVSAWFVDNGYTSKFALETYTFAAPTVGNQSFADHYNSIMLAANAPSHRVYNSKDFVPFGWAGLDKIIPEQIPTFVPFKIGVVIIAVDLYLDSLGIKYAHVNNGVDIGTLTPASCSGGSEVDNYFCWIGFEHAHNNYLRLLDADTVSFRRNR